jgi:hypothetical protein
MIDYYAYLCRLSVEDEWSETARYRALFVDGGPLWFKLNDRIIGKS